MRNSLLFAVICSVAFCASALAQPSRYESLDGNLGTWGWGKPQNHRPEESEEREPGETAWERLNAERNAEVEPPPKEAIPQSLSPLQLWRLLRGKKNENNEGEGDE
jgi:hypothetical protein